MWSRGRDDEPQAVISHESALSIHDLSDIMPSKIHFTVPAGFRKKTPRGCIIHWGRVPADEKEQREGFFVTKPLRTILDSAETSLDIHHLEQAIYEACDKGIIRVIDIASAEMPEKAREKIMMIFKKMKKQAAK